MAIKNRGPPQEAPCFAKFLFFWAQTKRNTMLTPPEPKNTQPRLREPLDYRAAQLRSRAFLLVKYSAFKLFAPQESTTVPSCTMAFLFRLCLVSAWIAIPAARIAQEAPKDVFRVQLAQECWNGLQTQIWAFLETCAKVCSRNKLREHHVCVGFACITAIHAGKCGNAVSFFCFSIKTLIVIRRQAVAIMRGLAFCFVAQADFVVIPEVRRLKDIKELHIGL